jgi:hypothetical protein
MRHFGGRGNIDFCNAVVSSKVTQQWADMLEGDHVSSCGWQWEVTGPAIIHVSVFVYV